jgi:hypothetical protein
MCGWSGRLRHSPETEVFVDPDEPEQKQLVAREGGLGGGVADDLLVDDLIAAAEIRDRGAAGRLAFWYQAALSLKVCGMTKPSPSGRIPMGVAYSRPERRPRWWRMPTIGIQRRPAMSRTSGLTNRAANRTIPRARGPRLMVLVAVLVVSLIPLGRATPRKVTNGRAGDAGLVVRCPAPEMPDGRLCIHSFGNESWRCALRSNPYGTMPTP